MKANKREIKKSFFFYQHSFFVNDCRERFLQSVYDSQDFVITPIILKKYFTLFLWNISSFCFVLIFESSFGSFKCKAVFLLKYFVWTNLLGFLWCFMNQMHYRRSLGDKLSGVKLEQSFRATCLTYSFLDLWLLMLH